MSLPPQDRRGLLIILSSPSGAGKSTLASRLRVWDRDLSFSVSATTRPMREGEADGVDYHFMTEKTFKEQVDGGEVFLNKAAGYLVFPRVIKVGIGVGGETGEGALRVGGSTVAYYRTTSGSIGFQLGAQAKSIVIATTIPPNWTISSDPTRID